MNFLPDDCLIVSGAFGERLSQIVQHVLKSTLESRGQNAGENVPITKEELHQSRVKILSGNPRVPAG